MGRSRGILEQLEPVLEPDEMVLAHVRVGPPDGMTPAVVAGAVAFGAIGAAVASLAASSRKSRPRTRGTYHTDAVDRFDDLKHGYLVVTSQRLIGLSSGGGAVQCPLSDITHLGNARSKLSAQDLMIEVVSERTGSLRLMGPRRGMSEVIRQLHLHTGVPVAGPPREVNFWLLRAAILAPFGALMILGALFVIVGIAAGEIGALGVGMMMLAVFGLPGEFLRRRLFPARHWA